MTASTTSSKKTQKPVTRSSPQKKQHKEQRSNGVQDWKKEAMEIESNEEEVSLEEINVEEVELISRLPLYILPWKSEVKKSKKDLDAVKYKVFTPLILDEVLVEGEL